MGFTAQPMAKEVLAPIELPARSVPWFICPTMRMSPIESVS